MIIDTASGFIGVLMLARLIKTSPGDWAWIHQLRNFKGLLAVMLFGAATAVPMCIYLFDVQDQGTFWSVYPGWLLGANGLFLVASGVVCVYHWLGGQRLDRFIAKTESTAVKSHTTALLWVMCPLGGNTHLQARAGDVDGGYRNEF